jgi:hypothetical protein
VSAHAQKCIRDQREVRHPQADGGALVAAAEEWLAMRFERTRAPTKYIAGFAVGRGREIAIDRACQRIQVWIANIPIGVTGYRLRNPKNPGQPYAAAQSRNSNLRPVAPTLAEGNVVYHLELEDLPALQALVSAMV